MRSAAVATTAVTTLTRILPVVIVEETLALTLWIFHQNVQWPPWNQADSFDYAFAPYFAPILYAHRPRRSARLATLRFRPGMPMYGPHVNAFNDLNKTDVCVALNCCELHCLAYTLNVTATCHASRRMTSEQQKATQQPERQNDKLTMQTKRTKTCRLRFAIYIRYTSAHKHMSASTLFGLQS